MGWIVEVGGLKEESSIELEIKDQKKRKGYVEAKREKEVAAWIDK